MLWVLILVMCEMYRMRVVVRVIGTVRALNSPAPSCNLHVHVATCTCCCSLAIDLKVSVR